MDIQDCITFEADFPDDTAWDARGGVIVPGGRAIALTLVALLESRVLTCSKPQQHSFYGWTFEVGFDGATIWCLLQYPGPWLILTECRTSVAMRVLHPRQRDKHQNVLRELVAAMHSDSRFTKIRPLTKAEFEAQGRIS